MSLLTDILGDLFLLAIGLAACIGAFSAFTKAKRIYGDGQASTPDEQHNGNVAKALLISAVAAFVWYDSFNLDAAIVRVAVPLGVYKFVQLVLTPMIGWHFENIKVVSGTGQVSDG
ncbi:MAG: hypothetical protein ABJM58_08330 [Alteripontixanthobacter sp.]